MLLILLLIILNTQVIYKIENKSNQLTEIYDYHVANKGKEKMEVQTRRKRKFLISRLKGIVGDPDTLMIMWFLSGRKGVKND